MNNTPLTNRHDFLILFEVTNGNPNGDPDAGNMPRLDPNTNRGLVSDVCLKRKVRNFVETFAPERSEEQDTNGFNILIKQGAVIETEQKEAVKAAKELYKEKDKQAEAAMKWLCREFFDVRTFGGVLGVGDEVLKGSCLGPSTRPRSIHLRTVYTPDYPAGNHHHPLRGDQGSR